MEFIILSTLVAQSSCFAEVRGPKLLLCVSKVAQSSCFAESKSPERKLWLFGFVEPSAGSSEKADGGNTGCKVMAQWRAFSGRGIRERGKSTTLVMNPRSHRGKLGGEPSWGLALEVSEFLTGAKSEVTERVSRVASVSEK